MTTFVDILKESAWNADAERECKAEWFELDGTNTAKASWRELSE